LLVYLSSKDISIGNDVEIVSKDDTNKVVIIKRNDVITILSYENAMNIFAEK
jgi:DtxR family Mn-dependent transcriptional regulator